MDINWLNSLMSMSEFGVVVGVALEGTEYIPSIHRRWPILEKVGFFILVLALIADWHFQSAINERHTSELISARDRIAELKQEAEQERSIAEQERLARTRIEHKIAPRSLTPKQQSAIIEVIKKFSGQAAEVMRTTNDDEVVTFSRIIADLLASANWQSQLDGIIPMPVETGLLIEVNRNDNKLTVPAGALAEALRVQGITTAAQYTDDVRVTGIRVIVGTKPH